MEDITQAELDDDQAYWCSQVVWPDHLLDTNEGKMVVESYRFVIFDISKPQEDE